MDFRLSDLHRRWQRDAEALGHRLDSHASPALIIETAAHAGLFDPPSDLMATAITVEALAGESASAALTVAVHATLVLSLSDETQLTRLRRGEIVGAISLSSEDIPAEHDGRLSGRASWIAPVTRTGLAIVGARPGVTGQKRGAAHDVVVACAVPLDANGCDIESIATTALSQVPSGHARFVSARCTPVGPTSPIMTRVRVLLAAIGLGMGGRALREALMTARAADYRGAGGEQTVQGLLADAATDLDAARLLTWKAASAVVPTLAEASMAKLAATEATQRAVARATQVIGAATFSQGHIVDRLAREVRVLELFAGRTEALRDAVAEVELARP